MTVGFGSRRLVGPKRWPRRKLIAAAVLCCLLALEGCQGRVRADGDYRVAFVWDAGLTEATVALSRGDGHVASAVRKEVLKQAEPIIAEQLRKANLTKARGQLRLQLFGPPPYATFTQGILILSPNISELQAAAELDDVDRIRMLIGKYQNVNQRELPSERTALFTAAADGHANSLKALLELGADPNVRDFQGNTALVSAVAAGSESCVQLLIAAGADVNEANEVGMTPLMEAAELGKTKIVALLLRLGARPELREKDGKTALDLAREAGHQEAVRILESVPARK